MTSMLAAAAFSASVRPIWLQIITRILSPASLSESHILKVSGEAARFVTVLPHLLGKVIQPKNWSTAALS